MVVQLPRHMPLVALVSSIRQVSLDELQGALALQIAPEFEELEEEPHAAS
jgi:hypothetical protein